MIKTYKSSSEIHISVMLPNGSRTRVVFSPKTGGGSTFITSDADIQAGLESHSFFGKQFVLAGVKEEKKQETAVEKAEPKGPKQVKVSSLDDAKEYLVEHFELSRTKLRSKSQIMAAAEANGIEFTGI